MHECRCDDPSVDRYLARILGPLLDRIDIHLAVPAVSYGELAGGAPGEVSIVVRTRVEAARDRQRARFRGLPGVRTNAQMSAGGAPLVPERAGRRRAAARSSGPARAVSPSLSPGAQDRADDRGPCRGRRGRGRSRGRGHPVPESGPGAARRPLPDTPGDCPGAAQGCMLGGNELEHQTCKSNAAGRRFRVWAVRCPGAAEPRIEPRTPCRFPRCHTPHVRAVYPR